MLLVETGKCSQCKRVEVIINWGKTMMCPVCGNIKAVNRMKIFDSMFKRKLRQNNF